VNKPFAALLAVLFFVNVTVWANGEGDQNGPPRKPPGDAAKEVCEPLLEGESPRVVDVAERLGQLPYIALDTPTIRDAIRNLLTELSELHPDFAQIRELERKLVKGEITPEQASAAAEQWLEEKAERAEQILDKPGPLSQHDRKILEGYRVLLSRGRTLMKRAQQIAEQQKQEEQEKENEQEQEKQDQDQQDQDKDQNQDKDQEGQDQDQNQDQQQDQQQDQDKQDQEKDDKQDGDKQDGDKQDGDKQDGDQQGKEKSDQQKPGDKPGDQPSDQPGQDGKEGEAKQGKGKKGKPKKEKQKQGKPEQSQQDSGKKSGDNASQGDVMKRIEDFLKKILKEKEEAEAKEKSQSSKDKSEDTVKDPKQKKDPLTNMPPKAKEKEAELPQGPLAPLPPEISAEHMKRHLDALWSRTLRQYENHDQLVQSLRSFQDFVAKQRLQYYKMQFLSQYETRAREIIDDLLLAQVSYGNLEDLGLSMIGSIQNSQQHVVRKLRFLDRIFTEISKSGKLTGNENAVHEHVRHLLGKTQGQGITTSDKELGMAFLAQLPGPVLRDRIKKQYASVDPKEPINWTKLAVDLRAGKLDQLLVTGRVRQYLNMYLKQTMVPKYYKDYRGPRLPINESEPSLELAEDLANMQFFHRDGAPPELDLLRLVSGDMLENVYRDQKLLSDPKKPKPKKVTVIVFDISGSMASEKRNILRDALIAAYVDNSQVEVILKKGEHVIYAMPFDTTPSEPERVSSLAQAIDYANRLIDQPPSNTGGTNITNALVKVYQTIAKHQKDGGDLDRANILLISDGEDQLDLKAIEKARAEIDPSVEIVMNAILIGDENSDIRKLAKGSTAQTSVGTVTYQHINKSEVETLTNARERLKAIEEKSADFNQKVDASFTNDKLVRLKQLLMKLSAHRELDDRLDQGASRQLEQWLKATPAPHSSIEVDKLMGLFLEAVETPLSQGWSASARATTFKEYLESVAKAYNLQPMVCLQLVSQAERARIQKWLGIP